MYFINNIKQDKYFTQSIKIIVLFTIVFFIIDAVIGIFLTIGLNKYYGVGSDAEIALIGHSHLMLGVDKNLLEEKLDVSVAKYTRAGVNVADRQIMVKHLLKQNANLNTVIYSVDAWLFTGEGLSANSYALFYPFLDNKDVNRYVKSEAGISEYWIHKLIKTSRFNERLMTNSIRGYLKYWSSLKFGQVDTVRIKRKINEGEFRRINNSVDNINILKETIAELEENKIKVILLCVPTIDLINNTEPLKFKKTMSILQEFESEYKNVSFLNYLEPLSHDYSLFFDPVHMNRKGQVLVTNQLIKDMQ